MTGKTLIKHRDRVYEIVPCGEACSFLSDGCTSGCRAPLWWREIHTDHKYGLHEMHTMSVRIDHPKSAKNALRRIWTAGARNRRTLVGKDYLY